MTSPTLCLPPAIGTTAMPGQRVVARLVVEDLGQGAGLGEVLADDQQRRLAVGGDDDPGGRPHPQRRAVLVRLARLPAVQRLLLLEAARQVVLDQRPLILGIEIFESPADQLVDLVAEGVGAVAVDRRHGAVGLDGEEHRRVVVVERAEAHLADLVGDLGPPPLDQVGPFAQCPPRHLVEPQQSALRLDHVVEHPRLHHLEGGGLVAAGGHHHDRVHRHQLEAGDELGAAAVRQREGGDHQIGHRALDGAPCLGQRSGQLELHAVARGEAAPDQLGVRRVALHHQDALGLRHDRRLPAFAPAWATSHPSSRHRRHRPPPRL